MADRKVMVGPRLRRMRLERGLTQSQMAEQLGISASYLNLIERNQRPVTVQLLLKLGQTYDIDYNSQQEGRSDWRPTYAAVTARSYHAGLVNAVLMDGSVRSYADTIELNLWRSLSTRDSGETVE